jgi:hypothetical protein
VQPTTPRCDERPLGHNMFCTNLYLWCDSCRAATGGRDGKSLASPSVSGFTRGFPRRSASVLLRGNVPPAIVALLRKTRQPERQEQILIHSRAACTARRQSNRRVASMPDAAFNMVLFSGVRRVHWAAEIGIRSRSPLEPQRALQYCTALMARPELSSTNLL